MQRNKSAKNVVVTGGAGFIGSHVTQLLCDGGYVVKVVDDLGFGYEKFIDRRATFIRLSLNDSVGLKKALKGADAVLHLAASSIISISYKNPLQYFENNVINGVKLLEAMRANGVKKIIFSSTSSVYGNTTRSPIKEEAMKNPLTIYAASKLAFEQALVSYYYAFGIESTTLRYFNVYGPRDEQRPRTRAIPMWIESILLKKPLSWYWQGRQKRDYVYVKDVAEANLAVLNLKGCNCFNVASGRGIPMKKILKLLERIANKKFHPIDLGERKGDPMESYADISKIKKVVGWTPKVSLEQGLRETFEYYKNQGL